MGREPTVIGISNHNGWAVFVRIAVSDAGPVVIDRGRVELIEPGLPNQPYEHETFDLDTKRAEELVKEVRESAVHCAERALARLRSGLGAAREIAAIALREPLLPRLPGSVAEAHVSSFVTVRSDAMLYHDALCTAASSLGITVELIARGEERMRAAQALRTGVEDLDRWLLGLRASLGPPWQKDHRDAAARAIAALGKHAVMTLPAT
jgi:hypothetical protein